MQTHQHKNQAPGSRSAANRATQKPSSAASAAQFLGKQIVFQLQAQTSPILSPVVQRDEYDNVDNFIEWVEGQAFYKNWKTGNQGDCAPAAKAIGEELAGKHFKIEYRGILLYHTRPTSGNAYNYNHFVIVVTIARERIVLDPTQGQFRGGAPIVAREDEWQNRFNGLITTTLDGDVQLPSDHEDHDTFEKADNFAKQRFLDNPRNAFNNAPDATNNSHCCTIL